MEEAERQHIDNYPISITDHQYREELHEIDVKNRRDEDALNEKKKNTRYARDKALSQATAPDTVIRTIDTTGTGINADINESIASEDK